MHVLKIAGEIIACIIGVLIIVAILAAVKITNDVDNGNNPFQ